MTHTNFPGSRWWKFDFHTHTPASFDYRGTKPTGDDSEVIAQHAKQWLQGHQQKGLDCVVITDHNSGQWLDALQKLIIENEVFKQFFILPGVEISCSGGVHMLAILEKDKTTQDIASLVGACGYRGTLGESNTVTDKSASDVIDVIHQKNGIAIAAHVDEKNGLFKQVQDAMTLRKILDTVDALQVVNRASLNTLVSDEECKKLVAALAQVQASDSHNAENTKSSFTWVKLTTPALQGLRLALAEPELSIVRSDISLNSPQNTPQHWIECIEIKNLEKRRQPMTIAFNPWLNTLIGGRGSGKSSVLECLRLALARGEEVKAQLGNDHEVTKTVGKFNESMVRDDTELKITVQGAGTLNTRYRYDWMRKQHVVMRSTSDGHDWEASEINADRITNEFPVRLFSQKQIYALANKPSGLLEYLDSARLNTQYEVMQKLKKELENAIVEFKAHRQKVRNLRQELRDWSSIKDQLNQVDQKLQTYIQQGANEKLAKLRTLRAESRSFTDFQEGLSNEITQAIEDVPELQIVEWEIRLPENASTEATKLAEAWRQVRDQLAQQWQQIKQQLTQLKDALQTLKTKSEFTAWENYYMNKEQEHLLPLQQLQTQLGGTLQSIGGLQQKKEELEQKAKAFTHKNTELSQAIQLKDDSYSLVVTAREKVTTARQEFVDTVLKNNRLLKITIRHAALLDEGGKEKLRELLKLNTTADYVNTFLGNSADEQNSGICAVLAKYPNKLTELKQAIQSIIDNPNDIPPKILDADIGGSRIQQALKSLSDEVLDALWVWFPEDKIEIQFRHSERDNWQDISLGSAGQQTGALLSFILSEGDEPLILDQPEDDLDNAMVYELIVQQLRQNKSRRQVIVVTHNPNIVVNADAELVIPMSFKGGQIQCYYTIDNSLIDAGGLQELGIRKAICAIMEGGKEAFNQRYKRVLRDMK